jgi:hypothetical protein
MKGLLSEGAFEEPRRTLFEDWDDGLLARWSPRPAAYLTPTIGRLGSSAMHVLLEPPSPPVSQVDGRRRLPQGLGGAIVGGGETAATQAGDAATSAVGRVPAALQQAAEAATGSTQAGPAVASATVPGEAVRLSGWQPAEAAPQRVQQSGNEDIIPAAAGELRCQGCGASRHRNGMTGALSVEGRTLCRTCAVKALEIIGLPGAAQTLRLQEHELEPRPLRPLR